MSRGRVSRRQDDVVDVAARRGGVRVGEPLLVVGDEPRALGRRIGRGGDRVAVEDVDRALGAHHRDLRGRPREVHVAADVLAAHDVVRAAVGLARDDRQLGDRRLAVGVQQLRAVADDPAVLLVDARQEARHVDERHQRDVEAVAGPDEPRRLRRGVDVEGAGEDRGLLRDDADTAPAEPREAGEDVRRPARLDLEERAVVDDALDDLVHVVRLARVVGDDRDPAPRPADRPDRSSGPRGASPRLFCGRCARIRRANVERLRLVVRREVRDAAARRVRRRAAERLRVDVLVGHGLHDVGSGHEHVARALDHDREVGDRRRVHRAAGTRAHDHRQLRHDARRQRVAQEDVGVAAERHDALLDPGATRVVEPDDRRADLHRQVHDLADLLRVRLGQRSAEHREVLAEDEHEPAVDRAVPGDDAVAEERGLGLADCDA